MTDLATTATLQPYRSIHPVHAFFMRLLGPADSWDNPLVGTKYDPYYAQLRHRESNARRRARADERRARKARVSLDGAGAGR